ncbi:hypothetical protein LXJ59_26785, partial [Escherichia coli]|nr:hypothetical protein [Escherichia coli]
DKVTAFVIECEHHLARLLEADGSHGRQPDKAGPGFYFGRAACKHVGDEGGGALRRFRRRGTD